jgi:nucleotide-binding universal stress UspA family protein
MSSIKKIMVAVDFSEYSAPTTRYAIRLARDLAAGLLLVNVINQRDVYMMEKVATRYPEFKFEKHMQAYHQDRHDKMAALVEETGCEAMKPETMVRVGEPYEALLAVIEEEGPEMLVMGTKGRTNLIDTVIGSCAQKMFRRCPIPLLSMREADTTLI